MPTGIISTQGIQGAQGVQGIQGIQAFQGVQGVQGIQGLKPRNSKAPAVIKPSKKDIMGTDILQGVTNSNTIQ